MMRTKQLFKTRLLSLAALCSMALAVVSCANEDITQNGKETDNDKNYTEFVGGRPETRTTMDYNDGAFYWEAGDKIYVQDDNNVWQVSNNAPNGKVASFKFKVPGKFTDKASYKVYYPGKNGTDNNVTIPATQSQTEPNSTAHFGVSGDCGTADAARANGFHFTLDHQTAILVFQPYTNNTILHSCYLTKIEVTADDNITGTYTLDPSTGELTGAGTGKEINITTTGSGAYTNGISLTSAISPSTANKVYMHIKSGAHTLRVRYRLKSITDNIEGTITKNLPSFDYKKNNYYDMTANLDVKNYDASYCCWDAQQPFWYGHEWNAVNPADRWQPVYSVDPYPHASELIRPTSGPRAANASYPGNGIRNDAVNLCKDCPNPNELAWYAEKGDLRYDANNLWTCMGHLRKGGFWLKRKARMARDNSTTVANIESAGPDGVDWRTYTIPNKMINQTYTSTIPPSASEASDYLFVPAIGNVGGEPSSTPFSIDGNGGAFWSSNGAAGDGMKHTAPALTFYYDGSKTTVFQVNNFERTDNVYYPLKFE